LVNRDRHEITMEILRRARSATKKTEIMRDAGLSYLQANLYLAQLIERGLLTVDPERNFKTTKKGEEFLKKCEECPLIGWEKSDKEKLKSLI